MRKRTFGFTVLVLTAATLVTGIYSQIPNAGTSDAPKTESEIRKLISDLLAEDDTTSEIAQAEISKLDSRHVPILKKLSSTGTICDRIGALRILVTRLDKDNKVYLLRVSEIAKGGTIFSPKKELFCRRGAAYLLSESGDGIREMTKILKGINILAQQSVLFAFDDLTESEDYSNGRLDAMKEAIPVIAKSRTSWDRIVSGVSNEVLGQLADFGPEELKALAKKYVHN